MNGRAQASGEALRSSSVIEGWFPALTLLRSPLPTTLLRMNRVHTKTYGCQMNERDSDAVSAMLRARGYRGSQGRTLSSERRNLILQFFHGEE